MEHQISTGLCLTNNERYLLLRYSHGHWGFIKGHIEEGEDHETCLRRETEEETGIKTFTLCPDFKYKVHYFFTEKGKKISKDVYYYLGETKEEKVTISFEHTDYKWLPYEEALRTLTFQNTKDILERAEAYLKKERQQSLSSF